MSYASLEAVFILVLILVNGFFAMSEMALVAARKVRLKAQAGKGSRRARVALLLKNRMDKFLSTAQIGITMVAILTGAVSGTTIAARVQDFLAGFPILESYSGPLGLLLVVVPITYLTLIVGELVPKKLAVSYPEKMSGFTAPVMYLLMRLAMPAVFVLTASTKAVVRVLRISPPKEPKVTEDDIRALIREAVVYGEVEHTEREILERVFRLDDLQVGALMTHHSKIVWLDPDDAEQSNLEKILTHPHSRFPVARKEPFEVLGVIKAKEYLGARVQGQETGLETGLEAHLHKLESVPATMRVLRLLELFRKKDQMHFVLVVDEYNAPRGVVTFNDILEAMVGAIPTVQAEPEPAAVRREDGSWLLDGFMSLDEVQARLGIERPMREEGQTFDNLAGFVLAHGGDEPMMGKHFDWEGHRFEIVDMDGRRIDRILVAPLVNENKR
ncbi:hemolysin family protein [Desulfonatronum thioautotrophicum]|uniref:hemolysin family protein n=1 Tax=Desulfonatronum thioautotrophicum TaxID=617001 RepID=UPI0005EB5D9F|nr:hemolysin family protein [Desulfonatronum thioautotrophicum]